MFGGLLPMIRLPTLPGPEHRQCRGKTVNLKTFRRRLHHRQPVGQRLCRLPRLVQRRDSD